MAPSVQSPAADTPTGDLSTNTTRTSTPVQGEYVDPSPEPLEEKQKRYLLPKDWKRSSYTDAEDSKRRFRYLLGLTDLFRHFIDLSKDPKLREVVAELDAATTGSSSTSSQGKRNSRRSARAARDTKSAPRRRKTEREEDEELIHEEEADEYAATTILTSSPAYIHGQLREYQIQGLNWLISLYENRLSGILADEMGLGKTLQTISFLGYLRYTRGISGPFIVIVPKSTLDNWRKEFRKWTPNVNTLVLQGDKESRADLINERLLKCDFDVCICSFEMVIREKAQLKKIAWHYIVVDEAHRIKNESSALSQIIRLFYSKYRLLITGTPLQNNLHELWALLNFLLPDIFGDSEVFDQWFENQENDQDLVVKQLHKVLSPFLLRRVKADVEKSLLPKKEINLFVGLSEMQVKWYRKLLEKDIDAVNGALGKREGKTRLLNIVMQLRKCCNHPYLFEGAEPGPPFTNDEHLVFNSGKMVILDKLLRKVKANGSRVLIFSQMSRMLDILEDYCFLRDYEYCRIDGSTDHEDRIAAIDDFNRPDSDKFIFLLTTRAGGLGINLTTADTVVLYDSDWNPQADLQAMDRAHRIGQTKQVYVFRFITENTIEEKVLERATQKLRLDQLVIQQGRASVNSSSKDSVANSKDALLTMIQHGAKQMFESSGGTLVDDDIDTILKKGEERTKELNARYLKLGIDDLQKFTSDSNAYEWNGQDFTKVAKEGAERMKLWISPTKRERKEHAYSIDNYYKGVLASSVSGTGNRKPRAPKNFAGQDHQFFPAELKELYEQEVRNYRRMIGHRFSGNEVTPEMLEKIGKSRDTIRRMEQKKIDESVPLTEEEEQHKQELVQQGFSNWTRRDFLTFVHASGKYGRESYDLMARELHDKTPKEIEEYAKVFWQRYKEIDGYQKYISQIEANEKKAKKLILQQQLLRQKIAQYKAPLTEFNVTYPQNNSKRTYTKDADRFILVQVNKYGLLSPDLWDRVKNEIRLSKEFKFDWYFQSRSPVELSRRCNTLLLAVTREFEGPDAMKRKSGPKNSKERGTKESTPTTAGESVEPLPEPIESSDNSRPKRSSRKAEEVSEKVSEKSDKSSDRTENSRKRLRRSDR